MNACRITPFLRLVLLMCLLSSQHQNAYTLPAEGFGAAGPVLAMAFEADGGILTAGKSGRLERRSAAGFVDFTFNANARGFNDWINALAIQSDRKILVGGFFTSFGGVPRERICRFHPDGTLDATFNPGADSSIHSIQIQPDGKILVAGSFNSLAGQACYYLGRLNTDGSFDTNFNTQVNNRILSPVFAVALQEDGKILVGGDFTQLGSQPANRIGRLNSDGTPDPTFLTGANLSRGANARVYSLVVKNNGDIICAGAFTSLNNNPCDRIGILTSNALLHATGVTTNLGKSAPQDIVKSVALTLDGSIYAGGGGSNRPGNFPRMYPPGVRHFVEVATNTPAKLFSDFDVTTEDEDGHIQALALQPDGRLFGRRRFSVFSRLKGD